jgi:hypothetical protein
MPVNGTVVVSANLDDRDAPADASGSILDALRLPLTFALVNGAGALGVEVQYNGLRTLGASGSEDLDLAGGLTNRKGKVITLTKLKILIVRTPAANTGNITLRTSITNGMVSLLSGDKVLRPNSLEVIVTAHIDGWAVTAGTGDLIRVLGAEDDRYEIALAGEGTEA